MVKQAGIVKEFFKHLKNKKGQSLVDFAVVVFFCTVIGLAARESGLIDALADTYSDKVQIALGPSGISMSEANASGNQSTGNTSGDGSSGSGSGTSGSGSGTSGSGSGTSGSGSGTSGSGSGISGSGSGTSGSGSGTSGSGSGTSGSDNGGSGAGGPGGPDNGGANSGGGSGTPGIPAGGGTEESAIVIQASTPTGASIILQKYADYAKNHNLQQWQAVDPAWEAYQADGRPLGITDKGNFGNLIIWNWQAADPSWTSWNDVSNSWQWSQIKNYYETWKNGNS